MEQHSNSVSFLFFFIFPSEAPLFSKLTQLQTIDIPEIVHLYNSIYGLLGLLYLKQWSKYELEANISRCDKNFHIPINQLSNQQVTGMKVGKKGWLTMINCCCEKLVQSSGLLVEKKTKGQIW
jgi:hypothetical protein